ncbi:hypothetical protein G7Y89_g1187 [Cudoniella acicularis]|uniref:Ig-like domain-containing protein n=1 Tax=Cudoniella acicularis TaxID=354080 RepID=A0A8H4W787_9HELO|nr:hypothetical protein G7Y89_g1187 [Cudoniella acicularis]
MRFSTVVFSSVLIFSTFGQSSSLYSIQAGRAVPTRSSCTYITFYYTSAAEFTAATASFTGTGHAFCAMSTSTSTTASTSTTTTTFAPTATSTPTINVCAEMSGLLANPGFECTTRQANDWSFSQLNAPGGGNAGLVPSKSADPSHSGNYQCQFVIPGYAAAYMIGQFLTTTLPGHPYTFSIWMKLDPTTTDTAGCYLQLQADAEYAFPPRDTTYQVQGLITTS